MIISSVIKKKNSPRI